VANLPIRQGNLGIKQVLSLALPAFMASAASILNFQTQILLSAACSSYMCTLSDLVECSRLAFTHGSFTGKAVVLGLARHLICASPDKGTLFWATIDILLLCRCHTWQRRLAFSTAHIWLWTETFWRRSPYGSRFAFWLQRLCSLYLSLRIAGRHSRPSWLGL